MSNRTTILLGGLIVGLLLLDMALFQGKGTTFLAAKLMELVEYLAFWR